MACQNWVKTVKTRMCIALVVIEDLWDNFAKFTAISLHKIKLKILKTSLYG